MITILTQDKKCIVDCEDITVEDCFIQNYSQQGLTALGEYSTEERAKEVLMDIWERIGQGLCIQRYEMPEV